MSKHLGEERRNEARGSVCTGGGHWPSDTAKPSLLPNLAVRRRGGSMALPATARPERVLLKISDSSDLGGTCPSPDGPKLCGASLGFVCRLGQALLSQSLPTSTTPWDGSNSGASPAPARRPGAASTRREYFRRLRFSPDGKYALAQSETGIAVLSVEPFRVAFRVPAENASDTEFTSDGHFVFLTGASHASSRELTYVHSPARRVRADAEAAEADRSTATSAFPCRFARSCCRPNPKVAISITTSGTASPIPRSIMQR